MSHYLHVSVGDYQLLIRTDRIVALADGDGYATQGTDQRFDWQDRSLPVSCRLETLSASQAGRRTMIIFGDNPTDSTAFAMPVDEVVGSRNIDDRQLRAVPSFNPSFSRLFDGAYMDPEQTDGSCLLRLRDPVVALAPEQEELA